MPWGAMVRESSVIAPVVAHMPDWIRKDLSAKDAGTRSRAEEALTAQLLSALEGEGSKGPQIGEVVDPD